MRYVLVTIGIVLTHLAAGQLNNNWITEVTKDGSISVTYTIREHINSDGNKTQLLEYRVISKANLKLDHCLEVMKNDANHYQFMDNTTVSRRIKNLSENEWLSYYYIDTPWPLPDSDCVTHYTVLNTTNQAEIKLIGRAKPEAYPLQGVRRMQLNYSEYTFTDLGNGQVQIIIYSRTSPVVAAPDWMIKAWFPKGPASMMRGIITLAKVLD